MPGVAPSEGPGPAARGSPKRSRLSLKFFQRKEAKRALDFADGPEAEQRGAGADVDQVVPAAAAAASAQASPLGGCDKRDSLLPFVGLNNLGNTCYLNSVLQVLYFCPGFKSGVRHLFDVISRRRRKEAPKEEAGPELGGGGGEPGPGSYELICSLQALMASVEQLQASFLLNPDKYTDELATPPRRLLNTLRELNPMYEGYLQHDAQEVLQCILGHIQDTCQRLRTEEEEETRAAPEAPPPPAPPAETPPPPAPPRDSPEPRGAWKRKGGEAGELGAPNPRKRPRLAARGEPESQRQTRSRRRAAAAGAGDGAPEAAAPRGSRPGPKKARLKLSWPKAAAASRQPSVLAKFCSLGKIAARPAPPQPRAPPRGAGGAREQGEPAPPEKSAQPSPSPDMEQVCFELVERLFQGQLVLRTRCLECESLTERREDFQDISVPVQEEEFSKVQESSEISPEPKTELKSLKWAISQFASVERIVGEDKYFCENCHHYTEAERSLLFDKMPEVITIHLKCFAATGLEFDCYGGGLSKINTPLLTPLKLSLEEWSTKPTSDSYGLFAVVMHSGITISSGHYTASVKVTDLNSLELDTENFVVDQMYEMGKADPLNEDDTKPLTEDHDDEVSFRVSGSTQASKVLNKKSVEAVGLLGGQKSRPDYEFCSSHRASNPEKVIGVLAENRNPESSSTNGTQELDRSKEPNGQMDANASGLESKMSDVIQSLKEYEGKWLLFDDSEVKVTEEKDFLNSLSPAASSTSTPYLLFYKKIIE